MRKKRPVMNRLRSQLIAPMCGTPVFSWFTCEATPSSPGFTDTRIGHRFEQLVLEYDSDDIGELDEIEMDPAARSSDHTDRFERIMDTFLQVHNTQDHAHDSGHEYRSAADTSRPIGKGSAAPGQLSRSVATEADREIAAAAVRVVTTPPLLRPLIMLSSVVSTPPPYY